MRTRSDIVAVLATFVAAVATTANAETTVDEDGLRWRNGIGPYFELSFILVNSSETYADALRAAQRASHDLGFRLDLRGLVHDPAHGLTLPPEQCAADDMFPYPCYLARGRFDPGIYVSIERSDAYSSFEPGLFIVVAASGDTDDMASLVGLIRTVVPDAYAKTEDVYFGCMH